MLSLSCAPASHPIREKQSSPKRGIVSGAKLLGNFPQVQLIKHINLEFT